jgi:hypothetical protein
MTTSQPDDKSPVLDQTLKRRGLLAAAWAAVAGFVMAQSAKKIEAAQVSLIYENAPSGAPLNSPAATVLMINQTNFNLGAGANVLEANSQGIPAGLTAIAGLANNSTGVLGRTLSSIGVLGQVPSFSNANAFAIYGQNLSTFAGPGQGAGGFGVYGISAKGHGVVGAAATAGAAAVVGATNGVAGAYGAAFYGPVIVGGALTVVGGPKSAAVPHADGSYRRMYCLESPESWFEDFGEGRLECGQAHVQIPPDFTAVVALEHYHVFLTEYGGHNNLSVAERTPTGFRVESLDPGSTASFSWRLVAKRKDIEGARLASVTIPPEPVLPPPAAEQPLRSAQWQ